MSESRPPAPTPISDDGGDAMHAAVSWTYMPPERYEEALLRIRRLLKEQAGWWNAQDDRLEREAFARLGMGDEPL